MIPGILIISAKLTSGKARFCPGPPLLRFITMEGVDRCVWKNQLFNVQ